MSGENSSSAPGSSRSDAIAPYPSPMSSAAGSPDLQTHPPASESHPEDNRPSVTEQQGQGRPDSTQHLRAASAALQAAYRRIRQVRRSLVELTEPLPPSPDSLLDGIGPSHSALLLTASPVEEASDNDDAIDFRRIRANLAAVDRQSQEYLDRFAAPGSWSDHQPSNNIELPRPRRHVQLPSPSSSVEPLQQPAIRRSMLESQLARRRELYNSDDPSTFLGRRVAAREAAGPSRAAEASQSSSADPILRATEIEHELLHFRATAQQRRTDPGVVVGSRTEASRADIIRGARSLDTEPVRLQRQIANMEPRRPPNPRRWRAYRAAVETRQNSNNTQAPVSAHPDGRLSILSNFSVQNLPTPTSSISRDRPLLFEEPLSYSGQRRESTDIVESPIGSERSYFIHRRVNADGDELVHNINFEWDDDDPLSWLMSPRERGENPDFSVYRRRRFASAAFDAYDRTEPRPPRAPPSIPEPRRRGWARLDPDGNAIPSDEEEELERSRTEYRMRALHHSRTSAPAGISRAERLAQSSVDVPPHPDGDSLVTRTYIDDYPIREVNSPRVRLNSRDSGPRTGFGSVLDSVLSVDNRPSRRPTQLSYDVPYGSSVPFVVDPLPIPLSEMVPPRSDLKSRVRGVRVSRNAGFAGR
ncbi:hypothetical protein MSAN_00795400 [Mycena sanguinolenta]|uniref:Uncharacterized protein n=1 Tax=Mycena sanguinolenta TaxID=230812 RepID=A0A8H7DD93_9AGAR|nr:hypothetical protein MSAN_00795400 [Mycena sanguinolenta]